MSPTRPSNAETRARLFSAMALWNNRNALVACLAGSSECRGGIKRAHSIQCGTVLEAIADEGHVYMIEPRGDRGPGLTRVGRQKASSFTGYCDQHDTSLFRTVDFSSSVHFDQSNHSQAILLSLRAAARAYWVKLNSQRFLEEALRHSRTHDTNALQRLLNIHETDAHIWMTNLPILEGALAGTRSATARLGRVYQSLLQQHRTHKYHLSRIHVYSLTSTPRAAVASTFNPEFDLQGGRIGSLDLPADVPDVTLNAFPIGNRTWFVMLYHRRFVAQLAPLFHQLDEASDVELGVAFSKLLLIHCENAAYSPVYVESLSETQRHVIEQIFSSTVHQACPYSNVPDLNFFAP